MIIQFCHSKLKCKKEGGDSLKNNVVNEFKQRFPQYADKRLSLDSKGNIVTVGGRVLAVPDGSDWVIKSLGGRPTKDKLTHDLRVRVTDSQYNKLESYSEARKQTKAELMRDLIDEL